MARGAGRRPSQGSRSMPPLEGAEVTVAQTARDTIAWLDRVELLISAKQRHYMSRMQELELESAMPANQRCPLRVARVRSLAGQQLDDIRELLELVRDTLDQLPPQLQRLAPADALNSASNSALVNAGAFVNALPALPLGVPGDCPVCLSELRPCENLDVVALPCGGGAHCFHRPCLGNWAGVSARCPLCREPFGAALSTSIVSPASPASSSGGARRPSSPQRAQVELLAPAAPSSPALTPVKQNHCPRGTFESTAPEHPSPVPLLDSSLQRREPPTTPRRPATGAASPPVAARQRTSLAARLSLGSAPPDARRPLGSEGCLRQECSPQRREPPTTPRRPAIGTTPPPLAARQRASLAARLSLGSAPPEARRPLGSERCLRQEGDPRTIRSPDLVPAHKGLNGLDGRIHEQLESLQAPGCGATAAPRRGRDTSIDTKARGLRDNSASRKPVLGVVGCEIVRDVSKIRAASGCPRALAPRSMRPPRHQERPRVV
mmetsp:Transcript_34395/g.94720  ORF Transcript_34395/g.94720 Transcript_34395/m.94720 type:complete len:493 (-) Transcript_34395:52-1530(-)